MNKKITLKDKINPFPKNKCPKCGSDLMVVFGIAICEMRCGFKQDLYKKKQ